MSGGSIQAGLSVYDGRGLKPGEFHLWHWLHWFRRRDYARRRGAAIAGRFSRSKPVAMTVIFTSSPMASFITTPKLICTSSFCGGVADQGAGFIHLVQAQPAGSSDVDQHSACAAHAAGFHQRATDRLLGRDTAAFSPLAEAVPIMA